jgi:hypothetical protein
VANTFALPNPDMRPSLLKVGNAATPVIIVDNFWGNVAPIVEVAAALAPYPPAENHYPGLRRVMNIADAAAYAYIEALLEHAAPLIGGAYDIDKFALCEGGFSLVTTPPEHLSMVQRCPHFDSTDSLYFAVMHYLSNTAGTAFYRHRKTGIECVTQSNVAAFVSAARAERPDTSSGYIIASNAHYEQIACIEGVCDRLVIYPGNLLHSGLIGRAEPLSTDPRTGRLTTNIFIRAD